MIPTDQTNFANDLQACIASILEVPIETVPAAREDLNWLRMLADDLHEAHGVMLLLVDSLPAWFKGYVIGHGMSKRGDAHNVVMRRGELAHDPHPSRVGLDTLRNYVILVRC
jgi:hypothetical protein